MSGISLKLMGVSPAETNIEFIDSVNYEFQTYSGTVSLPSGLQEDDIVVFIGGHNGTGSSGFGSAEVTGYTTIVRSQADPLSRYVGYKVMGATPDTTFDIGAASSSGTTNGGIVIGAFRNVDTTTPFDVTRTTSTSSNSADCPAITTVNNGCMILAGIVKDGSSSSESTPPTGYTLVGFERSETLNRAAVACWYKLQSTAGTEDPPAGSGMTGDFQITMALRRA
jgi:hypothetical protein